MVYLLSLFFCLLALGQGASAVPVRARTPDEHDRGRLQGLLTTSQKGIVNNQISPANVNQFAPAWVNMQLGPWSGDLTLDYGTTKFALNLSGVTDAEIQTWLPPALLHPSYDHWFLLLNEPDLHLTPQQAADEANRQMALVLAIDPMAKFALNAGTGIHPIYKDDSYAGTLYALIAKPKKIKAIAETYYPYGGVPPAQKFLNKSRAWTDVLGKELWLSEWGTVTGQTPESQFDYAYVRGLLDQYTHRDARYALVARDAAAGYDCLLTADGEPTGVPF